MIVDVTLIITIAVSAVAALMFLIVLIKFLDGTVRLDGMLASNSGGGRQSDRLLLLVITIAGAIAYFIHGLEVGVLNGSLPDIPDDLRSEMLLTLGGSNVIYLIRKFTQNRGTP
jgi:hypothetical protein